MTRKCTIEGCPSRSGNPQHRGVTFHVFPFDSKTREIWLSNCRIKPEKNITKNVLVCSRHFRRIDFQPVKSNKFLLKQGAVPTIFPWGKVETSGQQTTPAAAITEPNKNSSNDQSQNSNIILDTSDGNDKLIKTTENEVDFQTPTKRPYENSDSEEQDSGSKMPRLYFEDSPLETSPTINTNNIQSSDNSITILNTPEMISSHQRKSEISNSSGFTLGVKIEAQDFNGTWHTAKIVEVDSDEREVLIRFEKSRKGKSGGGGIEEWIPMNSSRLRHIASQNTKKPSSFEIGEKCMARWTGARRFPATVTKIYGNDTYQVLFEDGIEKTIKGHHMGKLKQKPTTPTKSKSPKKDWPLISISSLNLEELNLPDIPKDGEWCCHWVNDQPIGQEGFLMVGDHKKPTVIVEDWRLPPNWIKHMYQRSNVLGKWDVILVSPQGKRFRSKADLKQYIEELGEKYNPDVYDFSIHRRRAKDIGAYVYTKDYKPPPPPVSSSQQFFAQLQKESAGSSNTTSPKTLAMTSAPFPNIPEVSSPVHLQKETNDSTQTKTVKKDEVPIEDGYVQVGALKVQIIDNLFRCPKENCNKNFRKENHLQIHIKHYHSELAARLGACPNMQELACKRTIGGTSSEEPLPKNHLPNVQFFAKLHQQDLANKTHRKSITVTTPASTPPLVSATNQDDDLMSMESNKKDNSEVLTTSATIVNETNQQSSAADNQSSSPTMTTRSIKAASNTSPLLTEESSPLHPTGDDSNPPPPVIQKPETKSSTTSRQKKTINRSSTGGSIGHRKSSRQKLTRKFVQSNISSSANTNAANSTVNTSTSSIQDTSFGVSDQEETRHSFNGGANTLTETSTITALTTEKKSMKKSSHKPEPLFIVSDTNLDGTSQSQTTGSIQENSQSPKYINENGEIIKIVRMRQEEIINCLCSYGEEDGLMIQCELCLCWQHGICNGIEKESQVPEKYICYICRNPQRGRQSLKYIHDQDWMYEGKLPVANYHAPSPDLEERFEILRKTHILTGNLLELKKFMHSLKVKINIAENKDHPKMYLWTNKWESSPKKDVKMSSTSLEYVDDGGNGGSNNEKSMLHSVIKSEEENKEGSISENPIEGKIEGSNNNKAEIENPNKNEKDDNNVKLNEKIIKQQQPTIPQPEAPIDPVECQRRLLDHIKNQQSCVMDRLQTIESQIMELESLDDSEIVNDPDDYTKTKEMISMYIKDLETMKNIAKINTPLQSNFVAY